MRAALAAVLALLLVGCGRPDCDGQFTVSTDFKPAQRTILDRVAMKWSAFRGRPVTMTTGWDDRCYIYPVDRAEDAPPQADGMYVMGYYRAADRAIELGSSFPDAAFEHEAMHEIGHSFHLEHVSDPTAIMGGVYDPKASGVEFTPADEDECVRVGACEP